MAEPKYYRKYTSLSESESEAGSETDYDSDVSSQSSFTNDVGNFANLARNLIRPDIGGQQMNSLSVYQGGGNSAFNYYTTTVTNADGPPTLINGEWLQIQLPEPMNILKYTILTPPAQNTLHFFPAEFFIIGSNDGNKWYFIDEQIISSPPNVANRVPVNFNLYNSNAYTYLRLIVTKLPHGCDNLRINQWNLYGLPRNKEGFTGLLDDKISYYDVLQPSLNNYSNFAISKPNYYYEGFNNKDNNNKIIINQDINEIILCGILTFLLLGAISFVSNKR